MTRFWCDFGSIFFSKKCTFKWTKKDQRGPNATEREQTKDLKIRTKYERNTDQYRAEKDQNRLKMDLQWTNIKD